MIGRSDNSQFAAGAAVPCFFFNDTATTEIYTLSLHDALPITVSPDGGPRRHPADGAGRTPTVVRRPGSPLDRKSTRLNSSHRTNSYAVFCLKKKTKEIKQQLHKNKNRKKKNK